MVINQISRSMVLCYGRRHGESGKQSIINQFSLGGNDLLINFKKEKLQDQWQFVELRQHYLKTDYGILVFDWRVTISQTWRLDIANQNIMQ